MQERSSSTSCTNEPREDRPNEMKFKSWDLHVLACLSRLPYWATNPKTTTIKRHTNQVDIIVEVTMSGADKDVYEHNKIGATTGLQWIIMPEKEVRWLHRMANPNLENNNALSLLHHAMAKQETRGAWGSTTKKGGITKYIRRGISAQADGVCVEIRACRISLAKGHGIGNHQGSR